MRSSNHCMRALLWCIRVCVWICLCVDATNVIRYGCRCRCVVVFISGSVVWCGAVSVRMQSIPFCERGNRNSVVVISTSSSSSLPFPPSHLPLLFPEQRRFEQRFLLVSRRVAVIVFFFAAASYSKDFEWFENRLLFFTVYVCRQLCFHFGFFSLSLFRPWGVFWFWISRTKHWIRLMIKFFSYCISSCTMRECVYVCCLFFLLVYILCISLLIPMESSWNTYKKIENTKQSGKEEERRIETDRSARFLVQWNVRRCCIWKGYVRRLDGCCCCRIFWVHSVFKSYFHFVGSSVDVQHWS